MELTKIQIISLETRGKYYYDYCDFDSLADTYLIQTIASNLDGFKRSLYFYKDADEIMYAGPVWDMDLCFGSGWTSEIAPRKEYIAKTPLAQDLIKIPSFREKISERYFEKYEPLFEELLLKAEMPGLLLNYGEMVSSNIALDWILWTEKYKCGTGFIKWPESTSFDTILTYRYDWIKSYKDFLDSYLKTWRQIILTQTTLTVEVQVDQVTAVEVVAVQPSALTRL